MSILKDLLLGPPKLTIAVAESLTAGRVQAIIAADSGSSAYFLGGLTAYSLEQKVTLLKVEASHAKAVNCVSAQVAEQMALGVCDLFGSQVGVATTGYAEASPSDGVLSPFAYWAVACRKSDHSWRLATGRVDLAGLTRIPAQKGAARAAVDALVALLNEVRSGEATD